MIRRGARLAATRLLHKSPMPRHLRAAAAALPASSSMMTMSPRLVVGRRTFVSRTVAPLSSIKTIDVRGFHMYIYLVYKARLFVCGCCL